MASTTDGDEVDLSAEACMPIVQAAGYSPETNLDRGVWMFYPLSEGVECFVDVSEYEEENECVLGFNAIFQSQALPATASVIISELGLPESYANESPQGSLMVHSEQVTNIGNANSDWFANHFRDWDRDLLNLIDRAKKL